MSCIYLKTEENGRKRNGRGAHPYLQTSNSSRFHCADKETDQKVIKRLCTESQKRKQDSLKKKKSWKTEGEMREKDK